MNSLVWELFRVLELCLLCILRYRPYHILPAVWPMKPEDSQCLSLYQPRCK